MRVAAAAEIFRRTAELHQHGSLVDHLAGAETDDMAAEHAVGVLVGEDLDETVGRQHRAGAPVRRERELADLIGDTRRLQLFLGLADRSDLGLRVDDARNDIVIDVAMLAGEDFGQRHTLVFRLVRQHRTLDHIADRIDAGDIGLEVTVDLDTAAIVECNTRFFEAEPRRIGLAAGGDQHDFGIEHHLVSALDRLEGDLGALVALFDAGDLGAEMEIDALLGEHALKLFRDFAVHAAEDGIEIFDDGDLGAEPRPDRAEFEADDAAADDDQRFRHLVERDAAGGRDDGLFIDLDLHAGNAGDIRTGGDDDVLAFDLLHLAVRGGNGNLAGRDDLAGALEGIDLVLLEQEGDAIDIRLHRRILVRHHIAKVERRRRNVDAERAHAVTGLMEHFGGMQQRLRRNAADVQAGAAIGGALFDNGDLEAELGCLDGADIAARAGSDNDHIIRHCFFPFEFFN
ncbi:hypothetical protein RHECNPAF_750070 [Rhizobium etli CNPAF512]|nr:hypothetical protein RHECNPAF_750070 [Rhizobium etli CNPAF512]